MTSQFSAYLTPHNGAFIEELAGQDHLPPVDRMFKISTLTVTATPYPYRSVILLSGHQLQSLSALCEERLKNAT